MSRMKLGFLFASLLLLMIPIGIAMGAAPLLQQSDLIYQGAFRVPRGTIGSSTLNYGGTGLAYNPARNSLFLVGHDWDQATAEISIPSQITNSSNLNNLATATALKPLTDALEGKIGLINPTTIHSELYG